jgi:hypothetical protein
MIMNKKIFTLLAGAFLLFSTVFSANAQGIWDLSTLTLGDSVKTLKLGPNSFYHLKVDSIIVWNSPNYVQAHISPTTKDTVLLYMGKDTVDRFGNHLFIDTINAARTNYAAEFKYPDSKAEESAAALWCTSVSTYAPDGIPRNITFDFTNKQQKGLLQADVDGYYKWQTTNTDGKALYQDTVNTKGGLSGWHFSDGYGYVETSRPLYTYIGSGTDPDRDSVAVLCARVGLTPAGTPGWTVFVKIASAKDVDDRKVEGLLLFSLYEASPFIVSPADFNTSFGTADVAALAFDPDAAAGTNPFLKSKITAAPIDIDSKGYRVSFKDTLEQYRKGGYPVASKTPVVYVIDTIFGSRLDSLGYIWLYDADLTTNNYLRVDTSYHILNSTTGTNYLQFGWGNPGAAYTKTPAIQNSYRDSVLYGQYAFRLVYYPTGDSILINPYQAAYKPSYDQAIINQYKVQNWTDSVVLANFTYYADSAAMDYRRNAPYNLTDTLAMVTARLKSGLAHPAYYLDYAYYHKLYVTVQNLSATTPNVITLGNTVSTQINFDCYEACEIKPQVVTTKTTLPQDGYLIRNARNQYLHVPLYSSADSAEWIWVEENVHPELLPSFQWIVEKKDPSSSTSPITITNREFAWLDFDVQLASDQDRLNILNGGDYSWNLRESVNADSTLFENRDKAGNTASFILLPAVSRNNPYLGYEYIDPDTALIKSYAFNFWSGIVSDNYLRWKGDVSQYPNTDTLVYANGTTLYDRLYFRLDTIDDGLGALQPYGYTPSDSLKDNKRKIVQLVRQPYRFLVEDAYKFKCPSNLTLINGEKSRYALGTKGSYKTEIGKPLFYLRHYYNVGGENTFALVQIVDTTSLYNPSGSSTLGALEAYLAREYNAPLAVEVIKQLTKPAKDVNPGIFVAAVDDQYGTLKIALRADASNVVATFRKVEDLDPIYRRFDGNDPVGNEGDTPDTLKFYVTGRNQYYLFENTGKFADQQNYWTGGSIGEGKKNYLGLVNTVVHPEAHTGIYVDTAYINRGTGYIKPQYLLAVRPTFVEEKLGCDPAGNPTLVLPPYTFAWYLINANDSAHQVAGDTYNTDYLWGTSWERLIFTPAIHANDKLYILNGIDSIFDAKIYREDHPEWYVRLVTGEWVLNVNALEDYLDSEYIIDINAVDNYHHDALFSFRFVERGAYDFMIESETTAGEALGNYPLDPKIEPCQGGWVKIQNEVPVISRSDAVKAIADGEFFNVQRGDKPVANESVATVSTVTVVGNAGSVSILNAAGKKVVINNILGQSVVNTVLTSDNATIAAPAGIVIVAVEGEPAVKALVK